MGVEATAHQGDLTDRALTRLVDTTVERFRHWDILVNTSAPGPQKTSFLYGAEADDTFK
jgi:NAD(P)-dependent dehydrogenase (short-subunit alcohol dehydrogenase family)